MMMRWGVASCILMYSLVQCSVCDAQHFDGIYSSVVRLGEHSDASPSVITSQRQDPQFTQCNTTQYLQFN